MLAGSISRTWQPHTLDQPLEPDRASGVVPYNYLGGAPHDGVVCTEFRGAPGSSTELEHAREGDVVWRRSRLPPHQPGDEEWCDVLLAFSYLGPKV